MKSKRPVDCYTCTFDKEKYMKKTTMFWIRVGVAVMVILLLWWLFVAILADADEELAWSICEKTLQMIHG